MRTRLKLMKRNFDRWIYNTNIFSFVLWTAFVADCIYSVMFLITAEYIFAVISVGKIAYCLSLISHKADIIEHTKTNFAKMATLWTVLYSYLSIALMTFGMKSGFQVLMLSMIPVAFFLEYTMRNSSAFSYASSIIIAVTNLFIISLNDAFVRDGILKVWQMKMLQSFNWGLAVFLTVFSATVFMAEVFNISNGLTRQNKKLNALANYDPLTGLLLRRPMHEKIDESVKIKRDYGREYSICIGDIDHFKRFNDTYGHDCGDVVLKTVAGLIAGGVGKNDAVCRWGGEEIMILFPDKTEYDAAKIVEQIRRSIEKNVIDYKGQEVSVTVTFGLSSSEKHIMSKDVIEAADKALYEGKNSGRNKVSCG